MNETIKAAIQKAHYDAWMDNSLPDDLYRKGKGDGREEALLDALDLLEKKRIVPRLLENARKAQELLEKHREYSEYDRGYYTGVMDGYLEAARIVSEYQDPDSLAAEQRAVDGVFDSLEEFEDAIHKTGNVRCRDEDLKARVHTVRERLICQKQTASTEEQNLWIYKTYAWTPETPVCFQTKPEGKERK